VKQISLEEQIFQSNAGTEISSDSDSYERQQDAQLSQRDRAALCVIVFAKSTTLELGDNHLRTL